MITQNSAEIFDKAGKRLDLCAHCLPELEAAASMDVSDILHTPVFKKIRSEIGLQNDEEFTLRFNVRELKIAARGKQYIYDISRDAEIVTHNANAIRIANEIYQRHRHHTKPAVATPLSPVRVVSLSSTPVKPADTLAHAELEKARYEAASKAATDALAQALIDKEAADAKVKEFTALAENLTLKSEKTDRDHQEAIIVLQEQVQVLEEKLGTAEETQKQNLKLQGDITAAQAKQIEKDAEVIKNLEEEIDSKEAEIKAKTELSEELLASLQKQIQDAERKAQTHQSEATGLGSTIADLQAQNEEYQRQIKRLRDEIAQLRAQLEEAALSPALDSGFGFIDGPANAPEADNALQKKYDELLEKFVAADEARAELETKNSQLYTIGSEALSQINALTQELADQEEKSKMAIDAIKGKLAEATEAQEKANAEINELGEKLETARKIPEDLITQKDALEGQVKVAQAEVASLTEEMGLLKSDSSAQAGRLGEQLETAQGNLKTARQELADVTEQLANDKVAQEALKDEKEELVALIQKADRQIEELGQQLLQKEKEDAEKITTIADELALYKTAYAKVEAELEERLALAAADAKESLEAQKQNFEKKIALKNLVIDEANQKRHRSEQQSSEYVGKLHDQLKEADANQEKAKQKIGSLEAELLTAEQAKAELEAEKLKLSNESAHKLLQAERDLAKAQVTFNKLVPALAAAKAQAAAADVVAREQITELQVNLKETQDQLETARETADLVAAQFQASKDESHKLRERWVALSKDSAELIDVAEEAVSRLEAMRNQRAPVQPAALQEVLDQMIGTHELYSPTAAPMVFDGEDELKKISSDKETFENYLFHSIDLLSSPGAAPLTEQQLEALSKLPLSRKAEVSPYTSPVKKATTPDAQKALKDFLELDINSSTSTILYEDSLVVSDDSFNVSTLQSTFAELPTEVSLTDKMDTVIEILQQQVTNEKVKVFIKDPKVREALNVNFQILKDLAFDAKTGQASMPQKSKLLLTRGINKATNIVKSTSGAGTPEKVLPTKHTGFFELITNLNGIVSALHEQLSPQADEKVALSIFQNDLTPEENLQNLFLLLGSTLDRYLNWAAEMRAFQHLESTLSTKRHKAITIGNVNWEKLRKNLLKLHELVEITG